MQTQDNPHCNFRAKELLELRRSAPKIPTITQMQAALIVKIVDDARALHEEATGCRCWYEAIAQADAAKSVAA